MHTYESLCEVVCRGDTSSGIAEVSRGSVRCVTSPYLYGVFVLGGDRAAKALLWVCNDECLSETKVGSEQIFVSGSSGGGGGGGRLFLVIRYELANSFMTYVVAENRRFCVFIHPASFLFLKPFN